MITIITLLCALALLVLSGTFSGLTLGLMSLSSFELKRKAELGDKEAQIIYPIRSRGNELLVTLIAANVLVNSTLTVLLDSLLAGLLAIIIATVLITLFGEIIPQAALKRHSLRFGAKLAPYIERMMKIMRPVSAPLGKWLDDAIGGDVPTIYSREELYKIMDEHQESGDSEIRQDELSIVKHALSFGDKPIKEVMAPRTVITGAEESDTIGPILLKELHESGHSRFPVYRRDLDHIVGTLYMRDLVGLRAKKSVGQLMRKDVYYVNEEEKLDHVLNAFLKTKHHIFIVVNEFEETVGVVTIEAIVEQVLGKKITDEFDQYDDPREVAKIKAKQRVSAGKKVGKNANAKS